MELDEEEVEKNTWAEVDPLAQQKQKQAQQRTNAEPIPTHLEAFPILEEEPNVAQGVAGALKLALKKGYIDDESKNNPAAVKKLQDLQAKNYLIEEKYYDEEGRGKGNRFVRSSQVRKDCPPPMRPSRGCIALGILELDPTRNIVTSPHDEVIAARNYF